MNLNRLSSLINPFSLGAFQFVSIGKKRIRKVMSCKEELTMENGKEQTHLVSYT